MKADNATYVASRGLHHELFPTKPDSGKISHTTYWHGWNEISAFKEVKILIDIWAKSSGFRYGLTRESNSKGSVRWRSMITPFGRRVTIALGFRSGFLRHLQTQIQCNMEDEGKKRPRHGQVHAQICLCASTKM